MNRLLHPLQFETVAPRIYAALDSLREKQATAHAQERLTDFLLCIQERNAIRQNEPHLLTLIDRIAVNRMLEKAIGDFEAVDWLNGQILRKYYVEGYSDEEVGASVNYTRPTANRKRNKCLPNFIKVVIQREQLAREAAKARQLGALPAGSSEPFFGRKQLITTIVDTLSNPQAPNILCITAMGGMGKTALAQQVARQFIPLINADETIWLTSQSQTSTTAPHPEQTFQTLMVELANQLIHSEKHTPLDLAQATDIVRTQLQNAPHFIIIDNIEEEEILHYLLDQLYALAGQTKFLITSRIQPQLNEAAVFRLTPLNTDNAKRLLIQELSKTSIEAPTVEESVQTQLLEQVAGHPLTLKLLVSLIADDPAIVQTFTSKRIENDADFHALLDHIYTRKWVQLSDPARTILLALPFVAAQGTSQQQLQAIAGLDQRDFRPSLNQLLAYGLLEKQRGKSQHVLYRSHALTREFAEQGVHRLQQYALDNYDPNSTLLTLTHNNLAWWQAQVENAFLLADYLKNQDQLYKAVEAGLTTDTLFDASRNLLLRIRALIERSENVAPWLTIFERALAHPSLKTAQERFTLLRRTGGLYRRATQYQRAGELLYEAERLVSDVLQDDIFTAQVDYDLALLLLNFHRYDEAKMHSERTLKIRRDRQLGPAVALPVLNVLSRIYRTQGNADKALQYANQALACADATGDQVERITLLVEMISIYGLTGSLAAAQAQCDEALKLIDVTGRESMRVRLLVNMARAYNDSAEPKHIELARQHLDLAEAARQQHPMTLLERAVTDVEWARYNMFQGEYARAQTYLTRDPEIWRKLNNEVYHGETLFYLAITLDHLKQPDDAKRLKQQAIKILQNFPASHRAKLVLNGNHSLLVA